MQRYTVYLYLETALHVSGGTSTHHQERIQLSTASGICHIVTAICRYRGSVGTGDECAVGGVRHPKHVEQFPNIKKMCNVASCWIYIGILLGAHPILHISRIMVKQPYICVFLKFETASDGTMTRGLFDSDLPEI
jgi:hypothetical protein